MKKFLTAFVLLLAACGPGAAYEAAPRQATAPTAPDSFAPLPTLTLSPSEEPLPVAAGPPTLTRIPESWKTYELPELGLSLRYPDYWSPQTETRYGGPDGFFELSTRPYAATVFGGLRTLCTLEANLHKHDDYGLYPTVFDWQGSVAAPGDGCSVRPSPDAPDSGQAALLTRYASDPDSGQIIILKSDAAHFTGLVSTLRLAALHTRTPSYGLYTSPLCQLSPGTPRTVESEFAGLRVSEYAVVDAACHPYNHFDSFQSRARAFHPKPGDDWLNPLHPPSADEPQPVQVAGDRVEWKYDQDHLFPVGAPSQLHVLRNGQVIYTLAIPHMSPAGGPVRSFWSWEDHWILEVENVVILDGEIQNQALGYDEMFEWHLVKGRPFYFFRKADRFGITYDGQIFPRRYQELIHGFLCCDPGAYRLVSTDSGARFYARRDGAWWYVVVEAPGPTTAAGRARSRAPRAREWRGRLRG